MALERAGTDEPEEADPLKEFYEARPTVPPEVGWDRPQGESSEEEGLEVGFHCSVCGSEGCRRRPDLCKEQERHQMPYYLWKGWNPGRGPGEYAQHKGVF